MYPLLPLPALLLPSVEQRAGAMRPASRWQNLWRGPWGGSALFSAIDTRQQSDSRQPQSDTSNVRSFLTLLIHKCYEATFPQQDWDSS